MRMPSSVVAVCVLGTQLCVPFAHAQTVRTFTDLQPGDFGYEAVVELVGKGIFSGYSDGTFRPQQKVTRSEALKIITSALMTDAERNAKPRSDFNDVPNDAWYLPYVSWAASKSIIDPASKTPNFNPSKSVLRVEFLKMLFRANSVDTNAFGEVTLPLASDVTDVKQWYYPYMRYALSSGVSVAPRTGLLSPNRELTRVDTAVLLFRFFQYRDGTGLQTLLDQTLAEITVTLDALEKNDLKRAEYASARALLAARGAHARNPDEAATKVAVKTSEAIRALVRAYKASIDNKIDDVIKLSQDAWFIAQQARTISPSASTIATQIQNYARTFADSARKQKK